MKLTKAQQMMLDIEKIVGGSINVIYGTVIFDTVLNVDEMKKAVNEIYRINPILRTLLVSVDGYTEQFVEDYSPRDIEVIEFLSKEEVHKYANENAQIPFDMNGSLCSLKIFISKDFCGVAYKLHHIISDGWTLSLIASHFDSLVHGNDVTSYSYEEHISNEDKYLQSNRYEKDKTFFIEQFEKCSEPTFFSDKQCTDLRGRRRSYTLTTGQVDLIKEFTTQNNISISTLFLSALSIYFNKTRNNSESFYIGIPYLNRVGNIEKNTAGLFINTTPTLIELDNNVSLANNIKKIEENVFATMRHQKFDFEDILQQLKETHNFTGTLHDVLYSYQNAQISGENFLSTWYHNGMQRECLQFHIDDRDDAGILRLHYDTKFLEYTDNQIDSLHESICAIVFNLINNPEIKLCDLIALSDSQKDKIIHYFNNTSHSYKIPDNSTIYSLFEETAKKNADKVCIKIDGKEITFGEFLNIAEQLDTKIRTYTKGEKHVVGVIADRSIEMYAAIYGIIRGGNAYMPISPDYPQDRIEYMLKNSKSPLCIAQGKYCSLAGENHINITDFIKNLSKKDVVPFACEEDDTAYVIYTSGSTGKPKGAKVSHKSAVNRILWMHDKYPLTEDGVILQKTPYTFDVSVWEIFWWGITGGSLAYSKPNEHFLPAKILDETDKNKVTHLHFVPSVFDLFLTHLEEHRDDCRKFNSVKYVFLSGEALSASLIERFYKLFDCNKVSLHNLYGPTECAVDVTYYDCAPDDIDPVPIGKPIYNTSMYVVDKYMKLVPIGVKGELCIGGVNVGQGYLNNPELTAEKFIDNPFGEGKLYKTGDLAYWREDGEIIFCGRMDNQIKLNGQRIELGEIESVISSSDYISSVAVLIKKIDNRDVLVAFCCGNENQKKELKEFCAQKLPAYMIPQAFVFIDEMPLNQSGKLDRKYLSTLSFITEVESIEKPLNETEKLICDAFCKVLNIDEIGRNSDFFNLGGTSISMISVLSDSVLDGVNAPEFIANSTPAKLAQLLSTKKDYNFKYLKPLYEPDNADKALILFPYAGGSAEAYAVFTNVFQKKCKDFSLFFIDFLRTKEDCFSAAKEIEELAQNTDIYFYSHCAGSAVAMQILNCIEENGICNIQHYIAGASIPLKKVPKKNTWNYVPDFIIKKALSNAGAQFNKTDKKRLSIILQDFRKDTDFMTSYFYNKNKKAIKCPVSLIMSKDDIFTKEYKNAKKLWAPYVENIANIRFIETDSHYFQSADSEKLIDIISDLLK